MEGQHRVTAGGRGVDNGRTKQGMEEEEEVMEVDRSWRKGRGKVEGGYGEEWKVYSHRQAVKTGADCSA